MSRRRTREGPWQLRLLGGWELRGSDVVVPVPLRARRLMALLALRGPCSRAEVAGELWPESNEVHARSSLRTTAGHVRTLAPSLLRPEREPLALGSQVEVDVNALRSALVERSEAARPELARILVHAGELLPGWYDDWVLFERERLRQGRIDLLDRLSRRLLDEDDLSQARAVARACVDLEPWREVPHRTLVRIHLAEGDRVEAFRVYQAFRRRSIAEFGLAPDSAFQELVAPLLAERQRRRGTPPQ